MNKIITTLGAAALAITLTSAMEMTPTTTMMRDEMKKDTMASVTMMKDDKMMDKKMDDKMKMTEEAMKMEMMYESTNSKSKKADIEKLQMMLIEKGYLKMPKGSTKGYYGNLTKKAVMKYKAAKMMMKDEMKKDTMASGTMMKDDKMIKQN